MRSAASRGARRNSAPPGAEARGSIVAHGIVGARHRQIQHLRALERNAPQRVLEVGSRCACNSGNACSRLQAFERRTREEARRVAFRERLQVGQCGECAIGACACPARSHSQCHCGRRWPGRQEVLVGFPRRPQEREPAHAAAEAEGVVEQGTIGEGAVIIRAHHERKRREAAPERRPRRGRHVSR